MSTTKSEDTYLPLVYANEVIAAASVLPALSMILTGLRFYIRRNKQQGLQADDWLLVPAVAAMWVMGGVLLAGVARGVMGYPTPAPPPGYNQLTSLLPGQALIGQLQYVFWIFMIITFGLLKLSVLFFYRRVFAVGNSWFNKATWVMIGFSVVWTVGFVFAQIFTCGSNPSAYWGPLSHAGTQCANGLNFLLVLGATDTASDAIIFFMPFFVIWRLRMSTKNKILVSFVLTLGAMSLVCSAIRLSLHAEIRNSGYAKRVDLFLNLTLVFWWAMLEAGIAGIAVNLPILHHFVGKQGVQSLARSVQSVLSLRSLSSRGSKNGPTTARPEDVDFTRIESTEGASKV